MVTYNILQLANSRTKAVSSGLVAETKQRHKVTSNVSYKPWNYCLGYCLWNNWLNGREHNTRWKHSSELLFSRSESRKLKKMSVTGNHNTFILLFLLLSVLFRRHWPPLYSTDELKARSSGSGAAVACSARPAGGTCCDDRLAVEDTQRKHVRTVNVDALAPRRPFRPSATLHLRHDNRLYRNYIACRKNNVKHVFKTNT